MMKQTFGIFLALLIFISPVWAQSSKTNFIIIIADDVSWDDLGCYGNAQAKTPNIDKMAADGLRFENVYLTASSCSPSRNSILTGRYPHNTGAAELHTEPPLNMKSLPEFLKAQGYYTAQAGKFHMGEYAMRGFDEVHTKDGGPGGEDKWVELLAERPKEKPFFMWFASHDAHRPWGPNDFSGTHLAEELTPPFYLADEMATKTDLAKYYDEIARLDSFLGKVMDQLKKQGSLDNTLIFFMADNGRPFPHSKTRVNDRGMKTPFVAHWPSGLGKKGTTCSQLISSIDIAPTVLQLAGVDIDKQFQGKSFHQQLVDPNLPFRNYAFAEHNWHDYEAHERMVRSERWLYILNSRPNIPQSGPLDAVTSPSYQDLEALRQAGDLSAIQADIFVTPRPSEELYDIVNDPFQLYNLAADPSHQKDLVEIRQVLLQWQEETGDTTPQDLTKSWYEIAESRINTPQSGIRGEMPGAAKNATEINRKGPF
ncbi:sulfatase [Echinicola sp. 20G]|uniref:sulfatase family protein n=1 Tax=Echinicola sp. 20G TaxID=2781961 RepID=UPI00190FD69A|nr:sulfatase [Echinicola sp. 20G]